MKLLRNFCLLNYCFSAILPTFELFLLRFSVWFLYTSSVQILHLSFAYKIWQHRAGSKTHGAVYSEQPLNNKCGHQEKKSQEKVLSVHSEINLGFAMVAVVSHCMVVRNLVLVMFVVLKPWRFKASTDVIVRAKRLHWKIFYEVEEWEIFRYQECLFSGVFLALIMIS